MIDDKLKEKVQMLICGDLEAGEKAQVELLINESSELQSYYKSSKLSWDNLDNLAGIEPSKSFVTDFWKKADKEKNKGFRFFDFFKFNWKLAGSFAVFFVASAFFINNYFSDVNSGFTFSEDVEILNQLDNAITLNSDSSLEVYGPW